MHFEINQMDVAMADGDVWVCALTSVTWTYMLNLELSSLKSLSNKFETNTNETSTKSLRGAGEVDVKIIGKQFVCLITLSVSSVCNLVRRKSVLHNEKDIKCAANLDVWTTVVAVTCCKWQLRVALFLVWSWLVRNTNRGFLLCSFNSDVTSKCPSDRNA
jgi:hypothetical protein